jgi:hypothetical protein
MRSRLDTGSAGRNCDWRRRPDIRLARRHVGPTRLYVDRRRTSVGEPRFDQRVIWCRPIGVDIGECGSGQGFIPKAARPGGLCASFTSRLIWSFL